MAYVYCHFRADDDQPFYVGMGKTKSRVSQVTSRSSWHKNVLKKHGFYYTKIIEGLSWEDACWWEIRWIKALKALSYPVVNLTNGGDRSEEHTSELQSH